MSLRMDIVNALGRKCGVCGWDKDPEVLQVLCPQGDREEYHNRNRQAQYREILKKINKGDYGLICPSCKFSRMRYERLKAKEISTKQVSKNSTVVWQTGLGVEDTTETFEWMKPYLEQGAEILVVAGDGKVYRHGELEAIEESWREFAETAGFPEDLGRNAVVVIREVG